MRDIVHIGYPRTATTWFQREFFPKVRNYTLIPRESVQQNIIHILQNEFNPDWVNNFRTMGQSLILSEEMILGSIRAGSINLQLLEVYSKRLKECLLNPMFIVFLRRQPESIYSMYNLYIKKGGTYSFKNFLRQDINFQKQFLFSAKFYCYDIALQILVNNFGKENIKVYVYEEFASNSLSFIEKFILETQLEIDSEDLNFNKINKGYSIKRLYIKKCLNHFSKKGIPFKHYFFNIPYLDRLCKKGDLNNLFLPKAFEKSIEKIMPDFIKSNQTVEKEYDLNLMKLFKYPL